MQCSECFSGQVRFSHGRSFVRAASPISHHMRCQVAGLVGEEEPSGSCADMSYRGQAAEYIIPALWNTRECGLLHCTGSLTHRRFGGPDKLLHKARNTHFGELLVRQAQLPERQPCYGLCMHHFPVCSGLCSTAQQASTGMSHSLPA